jgi:hypothetical protein
VFARVIEEAFDARVIRAGKDGEPIDIGPNHYAQPTAVVRFAKLLTAGAEGRRAEEKQTSRLAPGPRCASPVRGQGEGAPRGAAALDRRHFGCGAGGAAVVANPLPLQLGEMRYSSIFRVGGDPTGAAQHSGNPTA